MNRQYERKRKRAEDPRNHSESNEVSRPSLSLFHYTTAAGLIGIIKTQTLWATHADFLNDTAECQLLTSLLAPSVAADFREIVPRLKDLGAFKPEVMSLFEGDSLSTESERVATIALRTIQNVSPFYITSFCIHANGSSESSHGLLSQWRGYARGGFAIEFDELELDKRLALEHARHWYQAWITREVAYDNHEAAARLERFEGLAATALKVAFKEKAPNLAARPEVAKVLGDREMHEYIAAFMETLPILKSPRFKEENEYRIIMLATQPGQTEGDKRPYPVVAFREGANGAVVPYIELFKGMEQRLPIKKIIVGPHRDQANQYNAALLLMRQCGVDVPIVKSDTTLRF